MTVTVDQLRNLADRAATGLTGDEQARLRDGINQLEALQQIARGYCPDCGRGDATPTVTDWEAERHRANQAEAALDRIRWLAARIRQGAPWAANFDNLADRILAALDTPPAATQATEAATSPLRDLIAAAIYERNNPAHQWADAHPDDLLAYGFDADAVLAVIQSPAHNDGPSVEECREADRTWPLQKTGE